MPVTSEAPPSVGRVRRYLDKLFEGLADRIADRVADRLSDEREAYLTTLEVLKDEEALDDLRAGAEETQDGLPPPWDEVRRDLGLGESSAHKTRAGADC